MADTIIDDEASAGGGGSGDIESVTAGTGLSGGGSTGAVTLALATVTASRALVSSGSGYPAAATTTATEIGYVNGVTSAIQTQLDAKAATSYVDAAVEGLSWKTAVRVASTANVNIASAPTTIDGITLVSGDRVLLKNETSAPTNGIYIFNGAAAAMTRSLDASTWNELVGAVCYIEEGSTNGGAKYNTTTVFGGTLGVTDVTWTLFSSVSSFTASSTDTLTNKTFDADGSGNSITNIENADIKAAAAIARNKLAALTVSRALVSDGSGFDAAATTTATEIGYVNGVTSAIQTQMDLKAPITNAALVTPNLGTPSAGVMTNVTGTAASLTAGNATSAATAVKLTGTNGSATRLPDEVVTSALTTVGTLQSPVFVTPALGTPASGVATNLTGTAASLTAGAVAVGGVTGLGTGVATFLATPSSANLASALTDETGSGVAVFGTSPSFTTAATMATQAELRFGDSDNSNYVGFQGPATVAANKIWVLPNADGTNGQVLSTNGSLALSWATAGGGSSFSIQAKTADYTVASGDTGTGFTNSGAGGTVIFTLPTAVSGYVFDFFVLTDAKILEILCPASHTIVFRGITTASAGNIQSSVLGDNVRIVATGTNAYTAFFANGYGWQTN